MVASIPANFHREISFSSQLFAQKAARSIAEIQKGATTATEIKIFLEVLGYNEEIAISNGFSTLDDLVEYVREFVDFFDADVDDDTARITRPQSLEDNTPSIRKRAVEAMMIYFPWLTALLLLHLTGFSLWMVQNLAIPITTAFVSGIYLGIIFTEGFAQMFTNLLFSAYEQKNIGEVKRILQRMYLSMGFTMAGLTCIIFLIGVVIDLPIQLVTITIFSMVSISVQRINYVIFYALRENQQLFISYALAIFVLISSYIALVRYGEVSNDSFMIYLISLGFAFSMFSGFTFFYIFKTIRTLYKLDKTNLLPSFYKSTIIPHTLRSKFHVQFWETLPYFLFGMFYFLLVFGDRIIAWIFNPSIFIMPNGSLLPFAFNSTYHMGADPSLLFVLTPAMIVQYIIMSKIHFSVNQKLQYLKISEIDQINKFIRSKYKMTIVLSLIVAVGASIILNLVGEEVLFTTWSSNESLLIMQYASIANIMLSIFTANHAMLTALNRTKIGSLLAVAGAAIILFGGMYAGSHGYAYIIFAYLAASIVLTVSSTLYTLGFLRNAAIRFLGRYS